MFTVAYLAVEAEKAQKWARYYSKITYIVQTYKTDVSAWILLLVWDLFRNILVNLDHQKMKVNHPK